MIKKFRKKPVVIEAVRITDDELALRDASLFSGGEIIAYGGDESTGPEGMGLLISTLEGPMLGRVGDYIIKGVQGEFYPCKPDIFEATYETVEG